MLLPIDGIDAADFYRRPAMDHHSIAQIDTYMGGSARIVGALKEDKIAGTSLGSGNCGALTMPAFGGQSSEVESGSTVIYCIGKKE